MKITSLMYFWQAVARLKEMKDTTVYTLATIGVIAALSYAIAVVPVQAQMPGPHYRPYAPYVPPANNTVAVPPVNNTILEPPICANLL
ncbi:hypothetical protein NTE_00573 [Candidatus Nitrososphaera evergladensis SR1]|uniref:Uncharacterized protein n=1 Tax=Candidatus Nitrososphaera evergladensis SR1 TaxID=1459636 RepID=A0A075MTP4_9ARCH|nr:hypothetical protein NTE_00573 [Candidatus Nitrososphaera evergladensis SR1]